MTSLGSGICGFKLDNVGEKYVTRWNISFFDENEIFYYEPIDLIVKKNIKIENKTQYVTVGDRFGISCVDIYDPQIRDLLKCQLYDPQGTLVPTTIGNDCYHNVITSKMSDYGVWKCVLQFKNYMSQINVYYNIVEKENVIINLWQNETNMQVSIGCSFKNLVAYDDYRNFCQMIRPDGQIFSLEEGLATDRYTALGTNVSKAICGMEIKKPLEEFEKGLWRCEFNYVPYKNPIGGFINLLNETSTLPAPEIPKTIETLVDQEFSISCRVPYSSSYCFMRGPDKTIYPVENNQESTVGLCRFTKNATRLDNGIWACGFAKKTGEADALYPFEVVVLESNSVKPEKEKVESTKGSTVYLKCSTKDLGDYPIQYCRFKHPSGQIYNINPEELSTNRMSYFGRGFKYGDCGIEIKHISISDAGIWTCITRIGNDFNYPQIYSEIKLSIN